MCGLGGVKFFKKGQLFKQKKNVRNNRFASSPPTHLFQRITFFGLSLSGPFCQLYSFNLQCQKNGSGGGKWILSLRIYIDVGIPSSPSCMFQNRASIQFEKIQLISIVFENLSRKLLPRTPCNKMKKNIDAICNWSVWNWVYYNIIWYTSNLQLIFQLIARSPSITPSITHHPPQPQPVCGQCQCSPFAFHRGLLLAWGGGETNVRSSVSKMMGCR